MPAKKHRHSRPVNPSPKLILEALEPRIAPTVVTAGGVLTFTDSNEDNIEVYYDGPEGSQIDVLDTTGGAIDNGDNIGSIEITGSDGYSSLRIYSDGSGPGDTPIGGNGGIFTTGDESLGELFLNDFDAPGPAYLTNGEGITIGGALRTLVMSGPIDFDLGGNFITVGGYLGAAFFLDTVVLDSATGLADITVSGGFRFDTVVLDSAAGLADITAGADGGGDIGVMVLNPLNLLSATGGPAVTPQAMAGATPLVIADDVGDGTIGSLRLQLSGAAATADVWAVPVPGGGSVLVDVALYGEGTGLTVTAQGASGDVGMVEGDQLALGDIRFRGAAEVDVGVVFNAGGSLATVANQTRGGDLAWVYADTDAAAITTLASGKVGVIFAGWVGSPIFGSPNIGGSVEIHGDLGLLSTGTLAADVGVGGDLTTLRAGTIMHTDLEVGGNAGLIRSDLLFASDVWVEGVLEEMRLGRGGMLDSDLQAVGGIGTFDSAGAVVSSNIASLYDTGTGLVGGMIQEFRAPEMHDVYVDAFAGFGTVLVTGVISYTHFAACPYDPDVGGGIERFQVGGMADISALGVSMDAGQVRIGRGGMAGESDVYIGGNLGAFQNQGDMSAGSYLDVGGDLTGRLLVVGDMLGDLYGCSDINIDGSATTVQVNGNLLNSGIYIGGDAESVRTGDVIDDWGIISIGGTAGEVRVGALVVGQGVYVGGDVELLVVGNGSEGSSIYVGGSAGTIRVASSFVASPITVEGDVELLQVNGSMTDGSAINIGGIAGQIVIQRNLSAYSNVNVAGDLGRLSVGGSLMTGSDVNVGGSVTGDITVRGDLGDGSDVNVDGDLDRLSVGGSVTYYSDIDVGGNAGEILIQGDLVRESDVSVAGDLARLSVGGSLMTDSNIYVGGSVTGDITVRGDLNDGSDVNVDGDLDRLSVGGSVAYRSDIAVGGSVTGDITIRGDLSTNSDVGVGGDLDALIIGGAFADGSEIDVGGNATRITIQEWLEADGVSIDGNLEFLQVRSAVDGGGEDLYVGGDLGTALFASIVELSIDVSGSADEITVRGGTGDFWVDVGGDLGLLSFGRGAKENGIEVGGNATSIQVTGGADSLYVEIDGTLEEFLVRGTLVHSWISVAGGINTFTVTEVVTSSDISTMYYDGEANPIGGGIGTFRAGEVRNVVINTRMGIGEFVVQGAVTDSEIDSGGGINTFRALGLYDGQVRTAGTITEMLIGRGGLDSYSGVEILNGGSLVKLETPGFIFGDIYVTGDVTDILTGGADALPGSAPVDFLFVENHSFPTGGELVVEGAILGTIS